MGSGLILLVIVGAWLAVLVPMALRSHDSAASLRSADRFSDAMRVLSRKSSRDVLVPRRSYSSLVVAEPSSDPVVVARKTAAERRLRTLLVLVGTSLVLLGLGLFGSVWMMAAHIASDVLLLAFLAHLRRQAVLRRPAPVRAVRTPARSPAVRARRAPRIAGIPDRMPARPSPLTAPLPAPAARYEDRPLTGGGMDGAWSPVPVPLPTYVGKQVAPARQRRVLDLTKPGQWTAALEGEDAGLDILDEGTELDDILSRRRAVNGW